MFKILKSALLISTYVLSLAFALDRLPGTWSNWRGPHQNGTSDTTGLPSSWSPEGENLLWKAPTGGRSSPIIMGDRLYLVSTSGQGETEQEQVVCLNADTGKMIWQRRFNVYQSDVPPHRIGWASPVGDPSTERIYVMGAGGTFLCLDRNGKVLWERALNEEYGLITTHGGRTVTPVVFENLVIISGITSGWGNQGRGGHRYLAFDKLTGDLAWITQPGGNPYDTTYATPIVAALAGKILLVDGGADGGIYAIKARTGEKVWHYLFSKRGINASVVTDGRWIYASQGEENVDTSVMGRVVALDPGGTGDISKTGEKWRADGLMISYSSPALYNGRLYVVDNGSNLFCLDSSNGKERWKLSLGTLQRASPVYADGKLYVGTENGKFYILKPNEAQGQVLDAEQLSETAGEEAIYASVAIGRGRIYLTSSKATYCIGSRRTAAAAKLAPEPVSTLTAPSGSQVSFVQITPAEVLLAPGQEIAFKARSYDAVGNSIRDETAAWSLAGIQGTVSQTGKFTAPQGAQAGEIRAVVSGVTGFARIRVIPPLPWNENFDSLTPGSVPAHWVGAPGKFQVREVSGNKVVVKLSNDQSLLRRARAYLGPPRLSNYTMEADVFATEKRRQMPDIGIIVQRYTLVLAGNQQKLSIESWQPETERTRTIKYEWKPNVWYRMKLRVDKLPGGKASVRGKVWQVSDPEPEQWTIEKEDPIPNLNGSPGIFAYAHSEAYLDNVKVTENPK